MREVMAGYVESGFAPGIVTLLNRHGETHVETMGKMAFEGEAPMARDTIFRIASLSKPVTAVAAMILVEECRLRLDDPVDALLPELADRKVLKSPTGSLDDTVPAEKPITLRHLLTLTMGLGYLMQAGEFPIMAAANERGLLLGPPHPASAPTPDEWIAKVGELPLMFQPGERWQYDIGIDVLGVLIARAAGQPLETFMKERIFEPLGMVDTGFYVPEEKIDRLVTSYSDGKVYDAAEGGEWSRPPKLAIASGGLVSTADDYLLFARMMLEGGGAILSRPTVETMTIPQISDAQHADNEMFFGNNRTWGFGMGVFTKRDEPSANPGRFGWDGGLGTSCYMDPKEDLVAMLLTQQSWESPEGPAVWSDFWTLTYASLAD